MDKQPEEAKKNHLSPHQQRNIEELVRLSPQVIQSRVRRDALCTSSLLGQYTGAKSEVAKKS